MNGRLVVVGNALCQPSGVANAPLKTESFPKQVVPVAIISYVTFKCPDCVVVNFIDKLRNFNEFLMK